MLGVLVISGVLQEEQEEALYSVLAWKLAACVSSLASIGNHVAPAPQKRWENHTAEGFQNILNKLSY